MGKLLSMVRGSRRAGVNAAALAVVLVSPMVAVGVVQAAGGPGSAAPRIDSVSRVDGEASQSSTGWGGRATRAVDGNTDGEWRNRSVTSTRRESQPWWQVKLAASQQVGSVTVWNRTDCCPDRLGDFYVLVSSQPFGDRSLAQLLNDPAVTAKRVQQVPSPSVDVSMGGVAAQYVRVQLAGKGILSLAEVEVEVSNDTSKPTIVRASLSSTERNGAAQNAIDGNRDYRSPAAATVDEYDPWFQAELNKVSPVAGIRLWGDVPEWALSQPNWAYGGFWVMTSEQPFPEPKNTPPGEPGYGAPMCGEDYPDACNGGIVWWLTDPDIESFFVPASPTPWVVVDLDNVEAKYIRVIGQSGQLGKGRKVSLELVEFEILTTAELKEEVPNTSTTTTVT